MHEEVGDYGGEAKATPLKNITEQSEHPSVRADDLQQSIDQSVKKSIQLLERYEDLNEYYDDLSAKRVLGEDEEDGQGQVEKQRKDGIED